MSLSSCFRRRFASSRFRLFFRLIDLGQQLVALHFEFGAADPVAGAQQFHLVLIVADGQIGLRLLDLLVDLIEFELLFLDARQHFGIVELDDQILLAREGAERRKLRHLHRTEQVRARSGVRTDRAQFARAQSCAQPHRPCEPW